MVIYNVTIQIYNAFNADKSQNVLFYFSAGDTHVTVDLDTGVPKSNGCPSSSPPSLPLSLLLLDLDFEASKGKYLHVICFS